MVSGCDANFISDGYHTVGELYKHRTTLFIKLLETLSKLYGGNMPIWRTPKHSNDEVWDGWFLLGVGKDAGEQITYHLPMEFWTKCNFAEVIEKAPEFDGHTSDDVLKRIAEL